MAATMLERHHLLSNLDKATSSANYLECHEIKQKVDVCVEKEKELRTQMEKLKHHDESAYLNLSEQRGSEDDLGENSMIRGGDNTFMTDSRSSPDVIIPLSMSPPSRAANDASYKITAHSTLKALMIFLRFLNLTRKITPYLQSLYENQIIQCLEVNITKPSDDPMANFLLVPYCVPILFYLFHSDRTKTQGFALSQFTSHACTGCWKGEKLKGRLWFHFRLGQAFWES